MRQFGTVTAGGLVADSEVDPDAPSGELRAYIAALAAIRSDLEQSLQKLDALGGPAVGQAATCVCDAIERLKIQILFLETG